MMKKTLLIVWSIIFIVSFAYSQIWFREDYGDNYIMEPRFQSQDKNIIFSHMEYNQVFIRKVSLENGELLWEKYYSTSSYTEPMYAIECNDGKILIVGMDHPNDGEIRNYILLTDSNGEKIADTAWTSNNFKSCNLAHIVKTDLDSEFIITGAGVDTSENFSSFLLRVSFKNEKISILSKQMINSFSIGGICKNEYGYIVSGTPVDLLKTAVIQFNNSLEKIWEKNYSFSPRLVSKKITPIDNGYIISGHYYSSSYAGIMKIDLTGNIIWKKEYLQEFLSDQNDFVIMKNFWKIDNNLVACIEKNGITETTQTFLVLISSNNGDVLEKKDWYSGYHTTGVILLDDGSFVLGGTERTEYPFKGWAARINFNPITETVENIPIKFEISNYPNPFNPTTTLQYGLPEASDVDLMIFDITGRKIKSWHVSGQQAGWHEVIWNGTNQSRQQVSTGVYIYSLRAGDFVDTKKMVFMK